MRLLTIFVEHGIMAHIPWWLIYHDGSYTMMAKPMKTLQLHYPMIQFLIIVNILEAVPRQNDSYQFFNFSKIPLNIETTCHLHFSHICHLNIINLCSYNLTTVVTKTWSGDWHLDNFVDSLYILYIYLTDRHVFIWGLIQRKYIDYNLILCHCQPPPKKKILERRVCVLMLLLLFKACNSFRNMRKMTWLVDCLLFNKVKRVTSHLVSLHLVGPQSLQYIKEVQLRVNWEVLT